MITRQDIEEARRTGARTVIRATPVAEVEALSRIAGRPVILKPEHLQRTGSFKIRGAYNFISRLPAGGEVVAASAGNHAQGVALAASLTGLTLHHLHAGQRRPAQGRGHPAYGATVRLEGDVVDDCMAGAQEYAEATGAVYVPPFDDPLVIAGQGTVGLELADEAPEAEVVVVPVGGGGLIAGVATALAHTRRSVKVIGVEAAGAGGDAGVARRRQCVTLSTE